MRAHAPMYCQLHAIEGYDSEKGRAESILAAHGKRQSAMVILSLDAGDFVYGQCTFPRERGDVAPFKFVDSFQTLTGNAIFSILAEENGLRQVYFVEKDVHQKFLRHPSLRDVSGMFELVAPPEDRAIARTSSAGGTSSFGRLRQVATIAQKVTAWMREGKPAVAREPAPKPQIDERDLLQIYVELLETRTEPDIAFAVLCFDGEDHAFAVLERRLAVNGADHQARTLRGILHADNANWSLAAEDLRRVCASKNADWTGWLWLGKTEWALGQHAAALVAVYHALAADLSKNRDLAGHAHALRGVILADSGDHRAALKTFDTAVRLEGSGYPIHLLRAASLESVGQLDDALDAVDQALVISPEAAWALACRFHLLQQLGHTRECDEALRQWRGAPGGDFEASCFAAHAFGSETARKARLQAFKSIEPERNRLRAAMAMPRLVDLVSETVATMYSLGFNSKRPDDDAALICKLRKRLRKDWWLDHQAWYSLGVVLNRTGQADEAIRAHEHAVALEPGFEWGWRALALRLDAAGRRSQAKAAIALAHDFGHGGLGFLTDAAKIALAAGEKDEAQALATQAQQQTSENAAEYWSLGNLLVKLERGHEEVLPFFEKAARLEPSDVDYVGRLGVQLAVAGRLEAGLAELDKALALKADDEYAQSFRGVVLFDLKRYEEARQALESVVERSASKAYIYRKLAQIYDELRQREAAAAAWRKATEADPSDADGFANLGWDLWLLYRDEDAVAELEKALALNPDYPYALAVKGAVLRDLKRFEEARAALEHATRINPEYWWATNKLARVFIDLGQHLESIALCDRILRQQPSDTDAIETKASALMAAGRIAEAITCIRTILAVTARDADADAAVCRFFDQNYLYAELLEATVEAAALYPDNGAILRRRAEALNDTGSPAEAVHIADRVLKSDPNDKNALDCKVLAFFSMGPDYARDCVVAAETLYMLDPSAPRSRMLRGDAYWLAGRHDAATAEYAAALAHYETDGSHYAAGWCALQMGNTAAAIDHYNRYLTEHPENLTAASDRALVLLAAGRTIPAREAYGALLRQVSVAAPIRYRGSLVFAMSNIRARLPYLPSNANDYAHSVLQEMAALAARPVTAAGSDAIPADGFVM